MATLFLKKIIRRNKSCNSHQRIWPAAKGYVSEENSRMLEYRLCPVIQHFDTNKLIRHLFLNKMIK